MAISSPIHPFLGERKEVLAPQPMLFTVQYILSTLLRIPSTWENSHSSSHLLAFLTFLSSPAMYFFHFAIRFPARSLPRLFLSTALNLRARYFQIKFMVAPELIYTSSRRKKPWRKDEPVQAHVIAMAFCVVEITAATCSLNLTHLL